MLVELRQGLAVPRRQHLDVAHPCPLQPLEDRPEPHAVGIVGIELPGILHQRRERQGLAAGAGAKVDDLLAGPGAGEQGRDLRAFVLHLVPAFAVAGLGLDMRAAAGARRLLDAHPERRMRRRLRLEAAQRLQHLVAIGLQRVRPEIDGSAAGERRPFLRRPRPERALEFGREPFRIIAPDMGRRIGAGSSRLQPGELGLGSAALAHGGRHRQAAATSSGVMPQPVTSVRSTSARGLPSPMA